MAARSRSSTPAVERYGRRELVVRGRRLAGAGAAVALGLSSDAHAAKALDELDRAMRGKLLRPGHAGYVMATAPDALTSVLALRVPSTRGGTPTVGVNGMFLGPRPAATAALAGLTGGDPAPAAVSVVQRSFGAATAYFAAGQTERLRIAGSSRVARQPIGPNGRDAVVELIDDRHGDPRLRGGGIVLFAFGGAVGRVPRKATAYVHRDARFSLELRGLWESPSAGVEAANLAWIRHARLALAPFTSGEALQNYADRGISGWKRAYYAENLERLVATKRAVDPRNRFRHAQSIPTAL